jgi:hypothetical protein
MLYPLESGGYLPLNRHYKPLGFDADAWVNYEDFADRAVFDVNMDALLPGGFVYTNADIYQAGGTTRAARRYREAVGREW